jgi:hypothetical protein
MDDEPSKLQEEACGARPQGPHAPEADVSRAQLTNVVGWLFGVASCNETFLGPGMVYRRFVGRLSPRVVYPFNASGLRGAYVLGSHLSL